MAWSLAGRLGMQLPQGTTSRRNGGAEWSNGKKGSSMNSPTSMHTYGKAHLHLSTRFIAMCYCLPLLHWWSCLVLLLCLEHPQSTRSKNPSPLFSENRSETALRKQGNKCSTVRVARSEEHTSELQSLMRISYAVF